MSAAEALTADPHDVELATFERRGDERLAVSWREYGGTHFLDVRLQFKAADGTWRPTKKGITVKVAEIFGVHDALEKACELAKAVRR